MDEKDLIFFNIKKQKPTKSGWYLGIECADFLKDDWILWNVYWDKEKAHFYSDPKSTVVIKADYWLDPKNVKPKQALAERN